MSKLYPSVFDKISWSVGSLLSHDKFIHDLSWKCNIIYAPTPIDYVFGSIPCNWQGDGLAPTEATIPTIKELILQYTQLGIGCRFTFSRYDINENDLEDEDCNTILEILSEYSIHDNKHGVIVSSNLLADYIRSNYHNLEVIVSLVKSINEADTMKIDPISYYNSLSSKYDSVIIDPNLVDNLDLMSKLENKNNIGIIANSRCLCNCPMTKRHYEISIIIEQKILRGEDTSNEISELLRINNACHSMRVKHPLNNLMLDMYTINKLSELGYSNFILEGKDSDGITLIRDVGNWIFNPQGPYLNLAQSILGHPV